MREFLLAVLALPAWVAAAGTEVHLERAPIDPYDIISIQRGAKTFLNYCLPCHSANYMRYSRLTDLGLTEKQIEQNLVLTGSKVGDTMSTAMRPADASLWFGVAPPDLSVIGRARGADWLYSYLRGFYRDDSRPMGWNNLVFPQVAMPHVLYRLQGEQVLQVTKTTDPSGHEHEVTKLLLEKPGQLPPREYDAFVADLVNYLVYMGEPARNDRLRIGVYVMGFLAILFVLTYRLKLEYWKDVH